MFSRTCEYAIKIMIYMTKVSADKPVGLRTIAEKIQSPKAFTAKILQELVRKRLLKSLKGPKGGFCMIKDKLITLADIVKAIDGEEAMGKCILGFEECSEKHPCPLHHNFQAVRDHMTNVLLRTTLEELEEEIRAGKVFLTEK